MSLNVLSTDRHTNQLIEGLLIAIRALIPGARAKYREKTAKAVAKAGFSIESTSGLTGGIYSGKSFTLWFDLPSGRRGTVEICREPIPLSRLELNVLGKLPDALAGLTVTPASLSLELTQRISGRISLEHLWITKYVRRVKGSNFWTPALIIRELQELTYQKYENHDCTSGFIFTSQPKLYMAEIDDTPYRLTTFSNPISLTAAFFEKPTSFRYVDGRNAFYLIDNMQKIHGVLRSENPKQFDIIARCSQLHVEPLVKSMPGPVWGAYVGNNSDLNIYASNRAHFRWERNHWHLRDKSILETILFNHSCSKTLIENLCPVIYALSDLRFGAVLLIPEDSHNLPPTVGIIDNSELGGALRTSFLNKPFADLVNSHSIIGALSSDGLTTITRSGEIIGCGDIIDISGALGSAMAGGGRTHAATAASAFGLAIKVSEDGPISIFSGKQRLITL